MRKERYEKIVEYEANGERVFYTFIVGLICFLNFAFLKKFILFPGFIMFNSISEYFFVVTVMIDAVAIFIAIAALVAFILSRKVYWEKVK